jgi:hypothetical protein
MSKRVRYFLYDCVFFGAFVITPIYWLIRLMGIIFIALGVG